MHWHSCEQIDFPPKGEVRQVLASKMDGLQTWRLQSQGDHSGPLEGQGEEER